MHGLATAAFSTEVDRVLELAAGDRYFFESNPRRRRIELLARRGAPAEQENQHDGAQTGSWCSGS